MLFKIIIEYAWFKIASFIDIKKAEILRPYHLLKLKRATYQEIADILGDNLEPTQWELRLASNRQKENYNKRTELVDKLAEQIREIGSCSLNFYGFDESEHPAKDCLLGFYQAKEQMIEILRELVLLDATVPVKYYQKIEKLTIEKLNTRFRIINFMFKVQGQSLYMPLYHNNRPR